MDYKDFQLSPQRLDLISKYLAKKKVEKYVEEFGNGPTPEIEATFYDITPVEKETYRKAFYANDFVEESNVRIEIPPVIPNTPEENEVEETIIEALTSGTKNVTAETINNITIPAEVTVTPNITGEFKDGATIEMEGTKTLYLNNTSEEPVNITISTNGASVYLTGKFENVYFTGRNLYGTSGSYPEINGDLDIVPSTTGSVAVSATFQENANVRYLGDSALRVNNYNNEDANVNVYAPNSTVTINGNFDEVEATVSDDTLILNYAFHCNTLKINNGKVIYQGVDSKDFYNELIGENVDSKPYGFDVDWGNFTKIVSTPGVYKFVETFSINKPLVFGTFASGKFKYDFNGNTVTCGDASRGCYLIRGSANVEFVDTVGGGGLINNANSYGIWSAGKDNVVNIYGGNFEAYTHVLYAELGTINVYGGTFKCLSEDKTFTLNCKDNNYTAGTAVIKVYGGKFYNFNPAHSMSEPGGPVSFLAEGYKVVASQEGDDVVYTVVPKE